MTEIIFDFTASVVGTNCKISDALADKLESVLIEELERDYNPIDCLVNETPFDCVYEETIKKIISDTTNGEYEYSDCETNYDDWLGGVTIDFSFYIEKKK